MPRRKNLKPTVIYCLVDMRPETIATSGKGGKPFYVGKTVEGANTRLRGHKADAKRYPTRKVGPALLACGEHVRIYVLEVVPVGGDWPSREKFWISHVRAINSDCANISDGRFGMTGYVATDATRRKQSIALTGKKQSPEHRKKNRLAKLGTSLGAESRRKVSEFQKGRTRSPETREKMRAARLGKRMSDEARAKMRASQAARGKRQPHSEETKRKIGDANRGHKHSVEFGQRISDANRGRKLTDDHKAAIAEGNRKAYAEGRRFPARKSK